ncbi:MULTISPECIES: hypothetical protein [unclassified Bartonella]|uniref:hypothetical protein n=1 Tax=unclassified Bartonella TaxID=2645622 RepID=UPI0035D01279
MQKKASFLKAEKIKNPLTKPLINVHHNLAGLLITSVRLCGKLKLYREQTKITSLITPSTEI